MPNSMHFMLATVIILLQATRAGHVGLSLAHLVLIYNKIDVQGGLGFHHSFIHPCIHHND